MQGDPRSTLDLPNGQNIQCIIIGSNVYDYVHIHSMDEFKAWQERNKGIHSLVPTPEQLKVMNDNFPNPGGVLPEGKPVEEWTNLYAKMRAMGWVPQSIRQYVHDQLKAAQWCQLGELLGFDIDRAIEAAGKDTKTLATQELGKELIAGVVGKISFGMFNKVYGFVRKGSVLKKAISQSVDTLEMDAGRKFTAEERKLLEKELRSNFNLHHNWPMYLGGPLKQEYSTLSKELHDEYHKLLDQKLPRWRGAAFYQSLPPEIQAENFQKLRSVTIDFDKVHGTTIWESVQKLAGSE